MDISQLGSCSLFDNVKTWLELLQTNYVDFVSESTAHDEATALAQTIISHIESARHLMHKARQAVDQHTILESRILKAQCRVCDLDLSDCEKWSHATWNQLQVYKGMQAVFHRCVTKLLIQLVNSCLAVDTSLELFLDHFDVLEDDMTSFDDL